MKYEWIEDYLISRQGVRKDFKVEWQWYRYQLMDKLLAAICVNKEGAHIITLKCEPSFGSFLRSKYTDIMPGYYMNKEHWVSLDLNGNVPDEVVKDMVDQSYRLIFSSLSKLNQKKIIEG